MDIISAEGVEYKFYPLITPTKGEYVEAHTVVHTNPSEPTSQIIMDTTNNDFDKAHLYLSGALPAGQYFIRCYNPDFDTGSGTEFDDVFWVSRNGTIWCNEIYSNTTSDLSQGLEANVLRLDEVEEKADENAAEIVAVLNIVTPIDTKIQNATILATNNTLVLRGPNTGTVQINNLDILQGTGPLGNHVSVHGDGQYYFIPYDDVNGVPTQRPDSVYRFGRNHEEVEFSPAGDGLEIINDDNKILIQCSKTAATILIEGDKTSVSDDYFVIRDNSGTEILAVNHQDISGTCFADRDARLLEVEAAIDGASPLNLIGKLVKRATSTNFDELECNKLVCDTIIPKTGDALKEIRVSSIRTKKNSFWLGEALHISELNGKAMLQTRKASVPVYMQGIGVVEQDFLNASTTLLSKKSKPCL